MKKIGVKNFINIEKTSNIYGLKQIANDTLRIGDMSQAVQIP